MKINFHDAFVAISSNKIQLTVDFYRQFLARQPTIFRPPIYAEFQLNSLRLGIFQPKPERQPEFNNKNSSMSLCLEVENLEQAIAHVTNLGYPPPGKIIKASHGREIYVYDPGKNRIILHQSPPK